MHFGKFGDILAENEFSDKKKTKTQNKIQNICFLLRGKMCKASDGLRVSLDVIKLAYEYFNGSQ